MRSMWATDSVLLLGELLERGWLVLPELVGGGLVPTTSSKFLPPSSVH